MSKDCHPAYIIPFDELYDGLSKEVENGSVIKKVNGDLELFDYFMPKLYRNGGWNKYNILARGLILCPSQKRIVAFPFPKFFNLSEFGPEFNLPEQSFSVYEKSDGSLGIIYYYNGWHVATRGSFNSWQSNFAEKWLKENINFNFLHPETTYLTEIIHPKNRIVVKYDFEGLVLLGIYSKFGQEISYDSMNDLAKNTKFHIVKKYDFNSIEDIGEKAKELNENQEGFVVKFENNFRVKIKGEEYLRLHRTLSGITPKSIWADVCYGTNMQAKKEIVPEEFQDYMNELITEYQNEFESVVKEIQEQHEITKHLSDKELGLMMQKKDPKITTIGRMFLFSVRKDNLLEEAYRFGSRIRERIFEVFEPKGGDSAMFAEANEEHRKFQDEHLQN